MNLDTLRKFNSLYSLILKFYPRSYLHKYGDEMQYVFSESLKDAYRDNGTPGIVILWFRTLIDAAKSLITQHLDNQKGAQSMKARNKNIIMQDQIFLWLALITIFVLSIPLIAMQFTGEVDWELGDFLLMGTLIFGTGFLFVHVARVTPQKFRALLGTVFFTALVVIWVHLAVGIIGNWPFAGS